MLLGVAYYPEHWPRSRWETDAKLMRDAGITRARMGEFAWHKMEPREGHFDFKWLHEVVELLARYGVKSILCTPTPTYPAWLHAKYPDIHQRIGDGRVKEFGMRQDMCRNHPGYRKHARTIVHEMLKSLGGRTEVVAWQTDNEFGNEGDRCWCEHCEREFREWLRRRFNNDISALNAAWGTYFWSQDYNDFSEISLPRDFGSWAANDCHNPGLMLAFDRFSSDVIVEFQREQIKVIREHAPGRLITHNLMGLAHAVDYFDLAKDLDVVSWDNYPGLPSTPPSAAPHDLMRGVKQKNVWVMEQQSGPGGWGTFDRIPEPGQMRLLAYQAVARGADLISFFRWRSCRWGREQYWHGLLYHHGIPQRLYQEASRLGAEFKKLSRELDGSEVRSSVGIIFDWPNLWALRSQPNVNGLHYTHLVASWSNALARMGVMSDVIGTDSDWSRYKVLIAPTLHLCPTAVAERLKAFARQGGAVILGPRSGVKDEENAVVDELLPGPLRGLAGCHVEEYDGFGASKDFEMRVKDNAGNAWRAHSIADILVPAKGARTLLTYAARYYAGKPAALQNKYGKGRCIYVGTVLDDKGIRAVVAETLKQAGIETVADFPHCVEATRRWKGKQSYDFYLNYSSEPVKIPVRRPGKDLLTGRRVAGETELEALGVIIVKRV